MNKLIKDALEAEALRLEDPELLNRAAKLRDQVLTLQAEIEYLEGEDQKNKDRIKTIKDYIK